MGQSAAEKTRGSPGTVQQRASQGARTGMIALLCTLVAGAAALSVPTTPRTADVGVIGAGPAGLVLAHALRERGHSVRIFERRDSFRPVGAAVFMHPFALNSLRAISPALEERMLDVCTTIHTLSFTTLAEDAPSFRLDTLGGWGEG